MISRLGLLRKIDVRELKFSGSQTSKYMGGYNSHLITEAQEEELRLLELKKDNKLLGTTTKAFPLGKPKKFTVADTKNMASLKEKKKLGNVATYMEKALQNPSKYLSAGAKTFVEEWVASQIFDDNLGRLTNKKNKYTSKGNESENEATSLLGDYLDILLLNNTDRFDNDWITGEIDAPYKAKDLIIDIKNSYTSKTHRMFDKPKTEHEWQGHSYMLNYDWAKHYIIGHVLVSATEDQVLREVQGIAYNKDIDVTQELIDTVTEKMNYDNVPLSLRINIFYFERDEEKMEWIRRRVLMCRAYAQELIDQEINRELFKITW